MRWERSLDLILGSGEPWKVLDQAGMWLAVCWDTVLLSLQCAHESPGNPVKRQIITTGLGGTGDAAGQTSSQVMLVLLVHGPQFEVWRAHSALCGSCCGEQAATCVLCHWIDRFSTVFLGEPSLLLLSRRGQPRRSLDIFPLDKCLPSSCSGWACAACWGQRENLKMPISDPYHYHLLPPKWSLCFHSCTHHLLSAQHPEQVGSCFSPARHTPVALWCSENEIWTPCGGDPGSAALWSHFTLSSCHTSGAALTFRFLEHDHLFLFQNMMDLFPLQALFTHDTLCQK